MVIIEFFARQNMRNPILVSKKGFKGFPNSTYLPLNLNVQSAPSNYSNRWVIANSVWKNGEREPRASVSERASARACSLTKIIRRLSSRSLTQVKFTEKWWVSAVSERERASKRSCSLTHNKIRVPLLALTRSREFLPLFQTLSASTKLGSFWLKIALKSS